jgi:hypothetical protein
MTQANEPFALDDDFVDDAHAHGAAEPQPEPIAADRMKPPRSVELGGEIMARFAVELEADYRRERAQAAETLFNAIAEVLDTQRPSVETVLYVLDLLRFDALSARHAAEFGPGSQVAAVRDESAPRPIAIAVS